MCDWPLLLLTECFLSLAVPDKAIDLVDEACANSRVQLDSVPEDIDQMQRQKYRLQVEEQALSKEKDKVQPTAPHSPQRASSFFMYLMSQSILGYVINLMQHHNV